MAIPVLENWTHWTEAPPTTTVTCTKPSGVVADDLLMIFAFTDNPAATTEWSNNLTGWTFHGTFGDGVSDSHIGIYTRIADTTEGATESITPLTPSRSMASFYLRISGVNTTTPVNIVGSSSTGFGASIGCPSVTTDAADCLVFYIAATDGSDMRPMSVSGTGWTGTDEDDEQDCGDNNVSSGCAITFGSRGLASAGASNIATVAYVGDDGAVGVQIAIEGAAGGGTPKSSTDSGTFNKDTAEQDISDRSFELFEQVVVDAEEEVIISKDNWLNDSGIITATDTGTVFSNLIFETGSDTDDITQLESYTLDQLGAAAKSGTESVTTWGSTETNAQLDKLDVSAQKVGNDSGALADVSYTNPILWSEEFANIPWVITTNPFPTAIIDSNAELDPNGLLNADRIRNGGFSSVAPAMYQTATISPSTKVWASCFGKIDAVGYEGLVLQILDETGFPITRCTFNIQTGAIQSIGLGVVDYGVVDYGNGWYRCYFSIINGTETTRSLFVETRDIDTGDHSGASAFIWGANLVSYTEFPDYVPTQGTAATLTGERAVQLLIDDSKSATDSTILGSIENTGVGISGTVLKFDTEDGIFVSLEVVGVDKPKFGSDTFSLIGATESYIIDQVTYEPAWEDDDVTWGGLQLGSKDLAPVYVNAELFYVMGRGTENYLDSYIERKAAVFDNGKALLGRGVYPQITGSQGQVIQISLGGHDLPDGTIDWEGPYDFTIGEDVMVDFAVAGRYLAVRFESSQTPVWQLQSFDVDYEVVGMN